MVRRRQCAARLRGAEQYGDAALGLLGPAPEADQALTPETLALFDRLAMLTLDADHRFAEMRDLYETDPALRVPAEVFNAVRNRIEAVQVP